MTFGDLLDLPMPLQTNTSELVWHLVPRVAADWFVPSSCEHHDMSLGSLQMIWRKRDRCSINPIREAARQNGALCRSCARGEAEMADASLLVALTVPW